MLHDALQNSTLNKTHNMSDACQILLDLVSTPSISGNEHDAAHKFVQHATKIGFEACVDEVNNAIAHRGADADHAQSHIVLLGHIDTVPGLIPVRLENGILHGRGSVDAKGPLCAMLVAASQANIPDNARITVIGAVGEEAAGSIGARHIVTQYNPDACIIGEPSGFDGVTLGYKGRLLCKATVQCSNAHSAGAELSAPDIAFQWWTQLGSLVDSLNTDYDNIFDQVQASILSMDSSSNGLSQYAEVLCGFRLPTTVQAIELQEHIESILPNLVCCEFSGSENAYLTDRNDPVVRALTSSIRSMGHTPRPKRKTGTADLNVVAPIWRCPIAAYGPGDSSLDHTPQEHLQVDHYHESIKILTSSIEILSHELSEQRQLPRSH